ncbi:hypothetical protein [Desulfovibrio cuneatus]|uniref:hypothetical protein n=1 Tax=Desulfovibrio cuneatus TaxID=159728 RepID=UPI0004141036|nr:hypothetical protein [Desulfovibrio cuneatus]
MPKCSFWQRLFSVRAVPFLPVALMLCVLCLPTPALAKGVGMYTFGNFEDHGSRLDVTVWFPCRVEGTNSKIDGYTMAATRTSRITPSFYPVVLLSHDAAASRFAHHDIATALAQQGILVIAPTHPGDNYNDSSLTYTTRSLYDRPRDMLRALELVLASPEFGPYADESRMGIVGVGTGAFTAMQLAGIAPNFSGFEAYCANAPGADPFCAPWVQKRLARVANEMKTIIAKEGKNAFTPAPGTYAPQLITVPVPPPQPVEVAPPPAKPSLWARIFKKDDAPGTAPQGEESTPPEAEPKEKESNGYANTEAVLNSVFDNPRYLPVEFQTSYIYGATDGQGSVLILPGPVIANFREIIDDEAESPPPSPVPVQEKHRKADVFLRPASQRVFRAVALVAPAGGAQLAGTAASIPQALALVEAPQDGLYAPLRHAKPIYANLGVMPELLEIHNTDHFSLFAACPREISDVLTQGCGTLTGAARDHVAHERDAFLANFFATHLGAPAPVPPPSGLVAAPAPQPEMAKPVPQEPPAPTTTRGKTGKKRQAGRN